MAELDTMLIGEPTPDPVPDVVQQLLEAHNQQRAARGKPPYKLNQLLQQAAQKHADHMARVQRLGHSWIGDGSPSSRVAETGYRAAAAAENVAWNYTSVQQVMEGWMGSSGHRAAILGNYQEMGSAVAYSSKKEPYWCSVFGTALGE